MHAACCVNSVFQFCGYKSIKKIVYHLIIVNLIICVCPIDTYKIDTEEQFVLQIKLDNTF